MKGFKKNGKFIPTGNRNKSSLSKEDLGRHGGDKLWTDFSMEELRAMSNNISYDNVEFGLANSIQNKITALYTQKKEAGQQS